jgi:glycosyltransferase involved in cell wall biosynthesis
MILNWGCKVPYSKNTRKKQPKIALTHDYLREYGGAERVLEVLHEMFPAAPVFVSFVDKKGLGIHWQKFADWDIRQSWMTNIPFYKRFFSPLRVLAPRFFQAFDLSKFDIIISSSNMYFAKAVRTTDRQLHISYCHTPPRALYGYTTQTNWKKNPFTRFFGQLINHYLRLVDFAVSQEVDEFVANSREVQQRIKKFYKRDSVVIHPPVNVPEKMPKKLGDGDYYLYVSRLAFAKHPEIALQACAELKRPLKIVGEGKMRPQLEELLEKYPDAQIDILGAVPDEDLQKLYQGAKALLYPVEDEDFGIVPVEAMGFGVPVIAHNSGGPRETVRDGETGILFKDLSVEGLKHAIKKFEKQTFSRLNIHKQALSFSKESFISLLNRQIGNDRGK